jgi:hypothetical protein
MRKGSRDQQQQHEAPADSIESMQEQYEQLLAEGIKAFGRYDELGPQIDRAWEVEPTNEVEIKRLEKKSKRLHHKIQRLLGERVALVRQIEKPKTIEDAFPAVRVASATEQRAEAGADVAALFNDAAMADKRPHSNQAAEATWSTDEWEAFNGACEQLAREHGYDVDAARIQWSKDGVVFNPTIYPFPSTNGMGGKSRVGRAQISVQINRDDPDGTNLAYYDRGTWDVLPTDADTLRSIDHFVAIFG